MVKTELMKRLDSKKGQAFPLAAVGVFIMAFSVIATLNLGQAVYEKIMLQNTADASAYSLAAMEARAFNFVALTNRTQIVNYNTAMALQSYLNYAGFCVFMVGTMRDLIADVTSALDFGCSFFPWPVYIPYCILAKVFKAITMVAGIVVKIAEVLWKVIHNMAPMAVEALGLFNKYITWQAQLIRLVLINSHIFSGMQEIITENYRDDTTGVNRMEFMDGNGLWNILINAALNTLEYRATFDGSAGLNPSLADLILFGYKNYSDFEDRKGDSENAVKIMAEIANASRSEKSIYNRKGWDGFAIISWLVSNVWGDKHGNTKLVAKGTPEPKLSKVHGEPYNYPVGDTVSSDDYLENGMGFATGILSVAVAFPNTINAIGSGIVAADKDGDRKHYGYKNNSNNPAHPKGSYNGLFTFPPMKKIPKKSVQSNIKCGTLEKHKWIGISPYFKYKPVADHDSDYNQPSTWIFLNIPPEKLNKDENKKPWTYDFKFNHGGTDEFSFDNIDPDDPIVHGGHSASMDTTIGGSRNSFFFEGLNAFSRGMAYYHRPGNWAEHPNFFNPFWRAKLAPIGNKLTQIFDRFTNGMSKPGADGTENDDVAGYLLNFARNFINDIFFGVITSVITH